MKDAELLFEDLHQQRRKFSPSGDKRKAEDMMGSLFRHQVDFVNDAARFKALLCPRRAGKSHAAAIYLIVSCLTKPNSKCVFATLTQKTARNIIWEALKNLDKYWQLNTTFHNTNLTMTFPSGSFIQLAGAESRGEIDKFRGTSYDLFILDECKSFPPRVITELVDQAVMPALSDSLGSLILMGTPGHALKGVFYEATAPNSVISHRFGTADSTTRKQWSFHTWTTRDNTKMPHIWEDQLSLKARKGWGDENPIWQREFLGKWIADDDSFVYKYSPFRNVWEPEVESKNEFGLPAGHDWEFVLGCDFGWEDPFAVIVSAFSWTHPVMHEVYSYKERHMHVADIARKIAEVTDMFGEFAGMVGDSGGMGKMVIEELNSIYGISIDAADKTQKRDYIELLNSDLLEGRIKVRPQSDLIDEWSALVWKDGDKDSENKSFANHLCDSFLYSWRYCFHHFFRDRIIKPVYGTPEFWQAKSAEDIEGALEKRRSVRAEAESWSDSMNNELGYSEDQDEQESGDAWT